MEDAMFFVSAATTQPELEAALDDLANQLHQQMQDHAPGEGENGQIDLAWVFMSSHFTLSARKLVENLRKELNPRMILGCSAEGVIGKAQEIENQPAIALVAAHMPGVHITPFLLQPANNDWHRILLDQDEFLRVVGADDEVRLFILLADPFSTPMDDVLLAFNTYFPGVPAAGGMASGALRPNGNALFLNDELLQEGAVGVALSGALDVEVVVSQGCRPIWRPFKVESAHRNVIFNLEGRSPLAWIQDLIPELPEEDRTLLQNGLFVGRAIKPGQEMVGRGDFLIRGVMGIDQNSGAIAIGDSIMEGEIIQFHLRDALTAQEDLEMMLIPQMFRHPANGALLFSCNGRGTRLYEFPNGDINVINQNIGEAGLAGFFCAGEIGPVSGANFLHGQTASLVLFRSVSEA
jgi:small ligand-binding sensory domain FIST